MISYIYKSRKKEGLYLYIIKKDDFSQVPQALYDSMGSEPEFVMELELTPDIKLAREDVITVIKNLESQGFHVQIPPPITNLQSFKEPANYVN